MTERTSFTRRTFLASGATALAASLIAAPKRKRNVLFIASDDLNNCLGCFGHPIVRTPNIDRIAKAGVHFEKSYCQFPLCSPSRTSLMTGLAPDTTTVYDLNRHFRKQLPDVVTLPQLFQKNGYFAGRAGKIYHYGVPGQIGTAGLDDPPSWNKAVNPNGVDHTKEEPLLTNYTKDRGLGSAICFHSSDAKDEEHTDAIVAAEVIKMMEEHRNEPFFLGAGFYRPHVPWIAPSKYYDMYPLEKIQAPPFDESEMSIAPEWAYFTKPSNWGMSVLQRREAIRAYYASITFMDAQVGKLLDALDRLGLTQDTTIVFWGDNGYHLGEHGQWMKQAVFEPAARIPLLFGGAGVKARGKACRRTVELLDIYPTLASMCGLQGTPANLHGRNLAPLLAKADAAWDKPAITQVHRGNNSKDAVRGYSLRTERYRYTQWGENGKLGEELYDYDKDRREMHNLAKDPQSSAIISGLKKQLHQILKARGAQAV
jgi:iduronate 2-sulfatase